MHFPLKNQEDHENVQRIRRKILSISKLSSYISEIEQFFGEFSSLISEFGQSNGESMNTHKKQKKSPARNYG